MHDSKGQFPKLHIVICTYNRAHLIATALDAFVEQTASHDGRWAVLVVDNNCTDNTVEVVEGYKAKLPGLEVVQEQRQGLTEARQRGFWDTQSPWIGFVDDDCVIEPAWVENVLAFIERQPTAAGFNGHNVLELDTPTPKPWVGPLMFAGGNAVGDDDQIVSSLHGAGLVLRREAVERSGWLDSPRSADRRGKSLVSGGDNELAIRARAGGGELWFVPSCRLRHRVDSERLTFGYLARLNYRLSESNPLLMSMSYQGSSWFARFGLLTISQFAKGLGIKEDSLRAPGGGWRGQLLGICRSFGFAAGAIKLALASPTTRNEVIGLATPEWVARKETALKQTSVKQTGGEQQ